MIDSLSRSVAQYRKDGFISAIPALSEDQVRAMRDYVEQLEADHAEGAGGHTLAQFFRVNGHVVIPRLAEISRSPDIGGRGRRQGRHVFPKRGPAHVRRRRLMTPAASPPAAMLTSLFKWSKLKGGPSANG